MRFFDWYMRHRIYTQWLLLTATLAVTGALLWFYNWGPGATL